MKVPTGFSVALEQDYHLIEAVRLRKNSVYAATCILFLILVMDIFIDLDGVATELISIFFIANAVLSYLVYSQKFKYYFGYLQIILLYLNLEAHFVYKLTYFHVLVYWMPIIPLVAVLMISFRASFFWLLITVFTVLINTYIGLSTIGPSYHVEPRYLAFGAAGILFVVGFYLAYAFLYHVLASYYFDLEDKKKEISVLNAELNELNRNLEQKVLDKAQDLKERNSRLQKYAFMNAHTVRAPLTNIISAIHLYNEAEEPSKKKELLKMLNESAVELDGAVREVAKDLNYKTN